jgi:hypothetical protein
MDMSSLYGQGKHVFITTSMPLQWLYAGVRFGWTPARIQSSLTSDRNPDPRNYYDTINAAVSFSSAVAPESVPFFCRFLVQADGILNYDFQPVTTMSINPTLLIKCQAYRQGNVLFSLLGGAYTSFPLNDAIAYSTSFPIGWTAGATFGGKLDPAPGLFFIDVRFSMDMFNTKVGSGVFKRSALTICIGYEYGFITKK